MTPTLEKLRKYTQTFVAQTPEDLATLNRLVVDTPEGLGRRVRINSWFRPKPDISQQPMSPDEVGLSFLCGILNTNAIA